MGDLLTYRPSVECFRYGGKPFPGYPYVARYAALFHLPRVWMAESEIPCLAVVVAAPTVACVKLFPSQVIVNSDPASIL